ncbi:MAG: acyl carrier protein [Planctomycetota bacterium]
MKVVNVEELEGALIEIIRRDLKLGDVELTPTTSFASEDIGFDSLDYLMLITSIEKKYGIKLSPDEMGPETMRDLRTLATYLQTRMA